MPVVNAADVRTYAFLAVAPNPVGVDQTVQVSVWVSPVPPSYPDVMHGFTVTITKPDGKTETKGPLTAFLMGAQYFKYTPTTIGNYTFQFNYPGETFSSTGDVWLPSETPHTTLVVQQNPIQGLPENPLPTEYWTRPINSENRNWDSISGNWLMANYRSSHNSWYGDTASGYNPYSQAPRSPHIMWTREVLLGGLTGGQFGSFSYYSGQSYDPYLYPPVIMNGRLYYATHKSGGTGQGSYTGVICVDLRTGEELWQNEQALIDTGQFYVSTSYNGQGVLPYLWDTTGSTWDVYDPFSGELMFSFENATSGNNIWWADAITFGDDGSMLVYLLDGENNWFAMWNSTKAFEENSIAGFYTLSPSAGTYDWMKGIQWNVTIPEHHVTDPTAGLLYPVKYGVTDNVLVAKVSDGSNRVFYEIGYDMTTGQELWVRDTAVQSWFSVFGEGIYASFSLQERTWTAYDIKSGNKLWVSDPDEYPWGAYVNYAPCIANGTLYSGSFDGYVHAFDIKTGKEVWKFSSGNSGIETITGTYPFWNGPIIADGVVFAGTGEETPTQPLTRGNRVFAIDAKTGKEIWNISGYMSLRAIADGYLVGYNGYDNRIYSFGKGPSEITVTASPKVSVHGDKVLVEGMVTDISAGTKQDEQAARFPHGVPAMSDESMSAWMEYLYMQQPKPTNATGVKVTISVFDPNNNSYDVGTATSDDSGFFKLTFTPPVPGAYTIIATFSGSESYYSSSAETAINVEEAPAATAPPTPPPVSMADLYFLPATIGIIIAIAVVGAVLVLMLRKR